MSNPLLANHHPARRHLHDLIRMVERVLYPLLAAAIGGGLLAVAFAAVQGLLQRV